MNDTDRAHLAANIVGHASQGVEPAVLNRVIAHWSNVDPALGATVAKGLG